MPLFMPLLKDMIGIVVASDLALLNVRIEGIAVLYMRLTVKYTIKG
jgi:hypothetical protein